jgi:drug/metabolite transporter (DMT)-like permease
VVFYFPLVTVPAVGSYTALHWVSPEPFEWLVLIGVGLTVTAAQIFMTRAYQADRAANISNYNYLGVVIALFIGWVVFGETIGLAGLAGIGLIVAGVYFSTRFRQK